MTQNKNKNITIGIAGPITLSLIKLEKKWKGIPQGYSFPMISNLVNYLLTQDYRVIVYTHSSDIREQKVYKEKKIIICVAPHNTQLSKINFYHALKNEVKKMMKNFPSDVICANWTYEFSWAAIESNIPSLITIHDDAQHIFKIEKSWRRFQKLIIDKYVKYKGNNFIAISPYIYNKLSNRLKDNTEIIPNYLPETILQKYVHFKNKVNGFVTVCNATDKRKNVIKALEAFGMLMKTIDDNNLMYYLVGSGFEENGPIYQYIKKNKLPLSNFVFKGKQNYESTIELIANNKCMIHPSLEESFGMSVAESMIVGTPVIGGKNSGNVPVLLGENRGILVDINSINEIAGAMHYSLIRSAEMSVISNNAYEYSKQLLTSQVVPKIIDKLNHIIELNHQT